MMRITAEQAVTEQCKRGCDERLRFVAAYCMFGENVSDIPD